MKLLTSVGIWLITFVFALTLADVGHAASKKKSSAKATVSKTEILTDPDGQRYTLKRLRKKDIRYHKRADGSVRVLPYFLVPVHGFGRGRAFQVIWLELSGGQKRGSHC